MAKSDDKKRRELWEARRWEREHDVPPIAHGTAKEITWATVLRPYAIHRDIKPGAPLHEAALAIARVSLHARDWIDWYRLRETFLSLVESVARGEGPGPARPGPPGAGSGPRPDH